MQQYIMIHKIPFRRARIIMFYNLQHTFRHNRVEEFQITSSICAIFAVIYIIFLEVSKQTSVILKIFMLSKL